MRPLHVVVVGALGLAIMAAGCGGAMPSSNGGPATVKVTQTQFGRFLVDGQGHTVYLFQKDEKGESYCNGACAAVWPPLETSTKPSGSGIDTAALGTIKRDDGETQVTYRGHPLYYYAADASKPGKTKGEELEQFGDEWYVVGADGKPVEREMKSNNGSGSGPSSGGGGWG